MASKLPCYPYLPLEIIFFEILLCLSVKTLYKFRCVSKSWNALISDDPFFHQNYLHRSKQNRRLLLTTTPYVNPVVHSTLDGNGTANPISQFDNVVPIPNLAVHLPSGITSCALTCLDLVCIYSIDRIHVWNPATKDRIELPPRHFLEGLRPSGQVVAFGYVVSTKEYKVLCIRALGEGSNSRCGVYTLGSGRWRPVQEPPFAISHNFNRIATTDTKVYVLSHPFHRLRIARFDLEREEWSVVATPESIGDSVPVSLREVSGSVCLSDHREAEFVEIWLLKKGASNWVKEYRIGLLPMMSGRTYPYVTPVGIEEDGRVLMDMPSEKKLQHYDPKSREFQEFYCDDKHFKAGFYVESLTPVRI